MGAERKRHNKTRTGCTTCKRRRVKCDEQKPMCGSCRKLSLDCHFRDGTIGHGGPFSYPTPGSDESSLSTGHSFHFTTQDMELLHHWTLKTSLSISIESVWQEFVPECAFRNTFLLRAILALAASHKAYLLRKETGTSRLDGYYLALGAHHINLATGPMKDALENVTQDNAPAILNFGSCNFLYTLAASHYYDTFSNYFCGNQPEDSVHWLKIWHGIRVLRPHWKWIESSPIARLLPKRDLQRDYIPETPEEHDIDGRLHDLKKLWSREEGCPRDCSPKTPYDEGQVESFTVALRMLRMAFIFSSQLLRRLEAPLQDHKDEDVERTFLAAIMTWLHQLRPAFVALLDRQDIVALVVFAHYTVLLDRMSFKWYIEGVPQQMIQAISEQLGRCGARHLIAWPIERLL
ncbi:hypothetical protein EJ05DRAFT_505186 [Pseudovirgaria hyperparasitica]|uniref:Zn(2)-C6 fungal-type domain-containing protein n=1 Tax=Pseudovirgaria hyperparasitica TaxID=470096 RepID=A0A6A6VTT2_9PEZI|nr:uncharacterized protein EJ05DRAFT_505186 [Pseudovirgaria hyperparasitica]KAF2753555.1 hypothetical protein EJ05DRAFT_505186 [Pseudovirgaria hyperparasitica]